AAKFPPAERYLKGATLATSRIPVKKSYFANVKSCNYLPNVMMHKEALDSGVDFTVSVDEQGHLAEGSTANIALVTTERVLLTPRFERILQGTTVSRVLELAETLVAEGELAKLAQADITPQQAYQAAEILMCGTTLDTMPVVTYDGHAIGDGQPGPICRRLRDLLREDQQHGDGVLTGIND
ncbi:MAG: peptidase, partial [Syntrophobacteraceae bacterium CG07_land_8_20_14_0_80_61_8]